MKMFISLYSCHTELVILLLFSANLLYMLKVEIFIYMLDTETLLDICFANSFYYYPQFINEATEA